MVIAWFKNDLIDELAIESVSLTLLLLFFDTTPPFMPRPYSSTVWVNGLQLCETMQCKQACFLSCGDRHNLMTDWMISVDQMLSSSLWPNQPLSMSRLELVVTWLRKCWRVRFASTVTPSCALTCMPAAWFSGSFWPGAMPPKVRRDQGMVSWLFFLRFLVLS